VGLGVAVGPVTGGALLAHFVRLGPSVFLGACPGGARRGGPSQTVLVPESRDPKQCPASTLPGPGHELGPRSGPGSCTRSSRRPTAAGPAPLYRRRVPRGPPSSSRCSSLLEGVDVPTQCLDVHGSSVRRRSPRRAGAGHRRLLLRCSVFIFLITQYFHSFIRGYGTPLDRRPHPPRPHSTIAVGSVAGARGFANRLGNPPSSWVTGPSVLVRDGVRVGFAVSPTFMARTTRSSGRWCFIGDGARA